jgi:hypothetical protein
MHAWQHETYLPHWYYTLEEWANNLCIVLLGWPRSMTWWCCCCRSPSHNEPWTEKIDSPAESSKCVDALFGRSMNIGILHREWPVSHTLDRSGAQFEVSRKIEVSGFPNLMVWFWQIQPSPTACVGDGDRANLHQSGIWAREDKDRG